MVVGVVVGVVAVAVVRVVVAVWGWVLVGHDVIRLLGYWFISHEL